MVYNSVRLLFDFLYKKKEEAFVFAASCTLGHSPHSPMDSPLSLIGFAEMVRLVYVVITELSVHALASWTRQSWFLPGSKVCRL